MKKRLLLLSASTLVAILFAEGAVRLLPYLPINSMGTVMRPDTVLDHSLRPNSVGRMKSREYDVRYRINEWGLRSDEPREHALMILGDSFMEGYGVERGEVLADILRVRGMNVINAGTKSYSPLLEYLFLKHRGLAWNPDTVILFYDLSDAANDDYYSRRLVRDAAGKPERMMPRQSSLPLPSGRIGEWFDAHSALYAYAVHMALKYFPATDADVGYAGITKSMDPLFTGRDSIPDSDYFHRWDTSLVMLREMKSLLDEHHVAFAIVTYPYGHQVSADAWAEGRKGHGFPPGVSSDRPFRFLESWARSESIPILSLVDAFKKHPNPGSLYFTYDGHWTPAGHALAADAVAAWLEKLGRESTATSPRPSE